MPTFTSLLTRVDDLAAILYTSGTTAAARAMLTHGNLLSNAVTLKDYWGFQPGDVLIHALPIFMCMACSWPFTPRCSMAAR